MPKLTQVEYITDGKGKRFNPWDFGVPAHTQPLKVPHWFLSGANAPRNRGKRGKMKRPASGTWSRHDKRCYPRYRKNRPRRNPGK